MMDGAAMEERERGKEGKREKGKEEGEGEGEGRRGWMDGLVKIGWMTEEGFFWWNEGFGEEMGGEKWRKGEVLGDLGWVGSGWLVGDGEFDDFDEVVEFLWSNKNLRILMYF